MNRSPAEALAAPPARGSRYRTTRRVTLVGCAVNLVLAAAKIVGGLLGQSQGLVADGVHSLSDLVSDAVVLMAAREAARDPDADHPYGHGRIETAATVGVGLLLLATAAGLGWRAVDSLMNVTAIGRPAIATLILALGSMAAKEALFHYTHRAGRSISSRLLEANAWHHRSDALSSIIVAVGIGGALFGVVALDAVGALIVAVMIAKVGWDMVWQSLQELVDTGLEPSLLQDLEAAAAAVDGVKHVHSLRSRWMGHSILLDLHVRVGPRISVSEGHRIAEAVRLTLLARAPRVGDAMVHIDPEDDTDGGPSNDLPLRSALIERLQARWAGCVAAERVEGVTLHYLGGRAHLQIVLRPALTGGDTAADAAVLRTAVAADPIVGDVVVLERVAPDECECCRQRIESVQTPSGGKTELTDNRE